MYVEWTSFMCYVSTSTCRIPAPFVCQHLHSAHPPAFSVHMCSVKIPSVDLYEPPMSNSFAILHVEILLSSVEVPCFHRLDTVVGRTLLCGVFERVYPNADSLSDLKRSVL